MGVQHSANMVPEGRGFALDDVCCYPDCGAPADHWHRFPRLYITARPLTYCRAHFAMALQVVYDQTGSVGDGGPIVAHDQAVTRGISVGRVRPPCWVVGAREGAWPLLQIDVAHGPDRYEAIQGATEAMLQIIQEPTP